MRIVSGAFIVAVVITYAAFLLIKSPGTVSRDDRPQIGSVNGKPLYGPRVYATVSVISVDKNNTQASVSQADAQQVQSFIKRECDQIIGQIEAAAKDAEKDRLHVFASRQEIEAMVNKQYPTQEAMAADYQRERAKWVTYNNAAAEVFDQHQDPEKVYQTLVAPVEQNQDLGHKTWEVNLKRWNRPEGRAALARMAEAESKFTLEQYKEGITMGDRKLIENQKLDQAIDNELAIQDPKFRSVLDSFRKHPFFMGMSWETQQDKEIAEYVFGKRREFWQSRYAQQDVRLNDPKVAQQCQQQFSDEGIRVASK